MTIKSDATHSFRDHLIRYVATSTRKWWRRRKGATPGTPLNAAGGALFDVSASRVAYRLTGARATDVLASGCPLDLHSRAFHAGDCAQSVFSRVNAFFYKSDDTPTFVIVVARRAVTV